MISKGQKWLSEEVLQRRTLNLGSGRKQVEHAVNLDFAAATKPDLVCDLNQVPWLLPENHFQEVLAYDVIEHLENIVAVMEEIHRICINGAVVRITVPHFSCANAFTDPTHRHYFGWFSFHYFTGENQWGFYSSAKFRRRSSRIFFFPSLINKLVWRLANRYPEAYERRWAWLFPAWYLSFELEVIKEQ
jgi:hypothetical protein